MTTLWPATGCRRYGGCMPGSRCPEHRGQQATEPVGAIIARLLNRHETKTK